MEGWETNICKTSEKPKILDTKRQSKVFFIGELLLAFLASFLRVFQRLFAFYF
jgi:hypothetical protein